MRSHLARALVPLLSLLAGPAPAASPSPDGLRLAFSFIGGPESIYLAAADGSGVAPLVERPVREFRPEWFPDGDLLLFTSAVEGGPQLFQVDADDGELTALTPVDLHASDGHPSPDGRRIVFFRDFEDGFDLHVLELPSGRIERLTDTPAFREYGPRWSPDGKRILFVGRESADAPSDVWILDLASGERENATRTPAGDEFHPGWSPDGRRVTFVRVVDGEFAIQVVDLGSGEGTWVAHEPGVACFSPYFTPDGQWVTFTRNVFEGARDGLPGVFRARPDGTGLERLTGPPGGAAPAVAPSTDLHPTWSPDGGRIVFESDRGGSADLYVADLVSGAVQQLTDTPSDDARPDHDTDVVLLSVGADGGRCEELLGGRRGAPRTSNDPDRTGGWRSTRSGTATGRSTPRRRMAVTCAG